MMSNWNEVYTLDRQKQMTKESQEKDKNTKTNVMYKAPQQDHPIYSTQHDFLTPSIRREQERKDAFKWKVGIFVMTLISMAGIAAIWWAVIL